MNNIEVNVIVEGQSEQTFVRDVLAPIIAAKGIYLYPTQLGPVGHKGGNVNFDRAQKHLGNFLKQRSDTYVTTMFDYFRIDSKWPGLDAVNQKRNKGTILCPTSIAKILESNMLENINKQFPDCNVKSRFVPYIEMHEFEALLFSNANILAENIGVEVEVVNKILHSYNENPEEINETPANAPSKKIEQLFPAYRKIADGKTIASAIGIAQIREKCIHFNDWLVRLENLKGV